MIRSVVIPVVSLLVGASVSGCATREGKPSTEENFVADPVIRAVASARTPESSPFVFAAALPAPFRIAVLQAAQFRRTHSKWPADRSELEREFGSSSAQAYRLTTEADGSLAVRWETAAGAGDVAARLTTDYAVSYSLMPAVDAAAAVRASTTEEDRQRLLIGTAISTAVDALSKAK